MKKLLQFLCSLTTHRFPLYYEDPWLYAVDHPFAPDSLKRVVTCTRCGWYDKGLVERAAQVEREIQRDIDVRMFGLPAAEK